MNFITNLKIEARLRNSGCGESQAGKGHPGPAKRFEKSRLSMHQGNDASGSPATDIPFF